jgi:hypothetical protein
MNVELHVNIIQTAVPQPNEIRPDRQREIVTMLSDRSREIIRLFEERQWKRRHGPEGFEQSRRERKKIE